MTASGGGGGGGGGASSSSLPPRSPHVSQRENQEAHQNSIDRENFEVFFKTPLRRRRDVSALRQVTTVQHIQDTFLGGLEYAYGRSLKNSDENVI